MAALLFSARLANASDTETEQLSVMADPSISTAISLIAREYARHHAQAVSISFAPARQHAEQIRDGQEADLLITVRQDILVKLRNEGMADVYSQTAIARNRLAFVTYGKNALNLILIPRLPLSAILQKIDPDFLFVMGDPDYETSGLFGLKALRSYQMAGEMEPYFLFLRSAIEMHDLLVQPGYYGLMFHTEARRNPNIRTLAIYPESAHGPISYEAVIIAGSRMAAARHFLNYLQSKEAAAIFIAQGFEPVQFAKSESGHLARGSTSNESTIPN